SVLTTLPAEGSVFAAVAERGAVRPCSHSDSGACPETRRGLHQCCAPNLRARTRTQTALGDTHKLLDPCDCRCGGAPESTGTTTKSRRGARKRTEMGWP